ncbi:MAG TPA: branched-chain amino acid ABC transporter permease [Acidimicrobiales bacterium]|nr:branched-chain amino acid ABC transporter permease [Acidimicrobiales bacterium]
MSSATRLLERSPYLHEDYSSDLALFPYSAKRIAAIVILVAAALALPMVATDFIVNVVNFTLIAVIGAIGLQLLTGMAGQLSLGHAAFLGTGALVSSGLWFHFELPFWQAVPLAAVAGGLVGLLAGIPALRLRGLYLGITTLAVQAIVAVAGLKYQLYLQRRYGTGADLNVPRPNIGFFTVETVRQWYFLLAVIALVGLGFAANLARSRLGRDWVALRRREVVAESLGVNVARQKLVAFVLSGVFGGIAGALLAYYFRNVSIEDFNLQLSVEYLAMIIVGGLGSVQGTVYGAAFVTATPFVVGEAVDRLGLTKSLGANLRGIELGVFALAMMAFLLFESDGLAGVWKRLKAYFVRWPYRYTSLSRGSR